MQGYSRSPSPRATFAYPICTLCRLQFVYQEDPVLGWDLCTACCTSHSSDTPNTRVLGTPSHFPSFSVEFELAGGWGSYSELRRALVLLKHGFIRTKDGSVDDEYKSPIYQSLSPFQAVLPVLSDLSDLVNDACGTHLHVAFPVKERLRPLHERIFAPLVTHLEEHEEETIAFWGRTFNDYACQLLGSYWACFNLCTSYDTLEFRLPRFQSAPQYLAIVRFCRRVTSFLLQHLSAASDPDVLMMGQRVLSTYLNCLGQFSQRVA